ncbi:MAG TPA: 6-phosphogluconolactonase [Bryobacteraceae bacterium]|jgi:6-phosphogluconolactonase
MTGKATPKRHVLADAREAADACALRILGLLNEALSGRETATLAISGGHTPKPMFEKMADQPFEWKRTHLFWVDERCVPPGDPESNYKLAMDYLISRARIPERNLHRIVGEIAPEEAAAWYTQEIRAFFGLAAEEMPAFDIVQCGMGPDGHTASLFPGDPMIHDRKGIAAARFAPQFQQWRVTLLPGPLLAARSRLYLVTGADKKDMLRTVFGGPVEGDRYPAQVIGHSAEWFIDTAADPGV